MASGTKALFIVVLVPLVAGFGLYRFVAGGSTSDYLRQLEQRPYTDRDLASEYGLSPAQSRESGGPLGYLATASAANQLNNSIEAEASRIQMEYEDVAGLTALLRPVDARRIAKQRFADQHLLPAED